MNKSDRNAGSKEYQRSLKFNKKSDKDFEKQTYGQSAKEKRKSLNDFYNGKTKYNKDTHKWGYK